MRIVAFLLALAAAGSAHAASSALPLTPLYTSVLGGERQVYSVLFRDASGAPSVGESVTFDNDACGYFDNGGFTATVRTDATGVASVGFTARAQGITCWINAQAGATVRFSVFTYTMGQVSLSAAFPQERLPGESFTFTAGANAGVYPILNAEITARVIGGTSGAQLAPSRGNTGQGGSYAFRVMPSGPPGDFEVEVGLKNLTKRFKVRTPGSPLQDMWWAGTGENGWGMSLVQHGERIFATIYVYDAAGAPTWFVMPAGSWNDAKTVYSGALYSPRGTPFAAYDASRLEVGAARGTARLEFASPESALLSYEIDGVAGSKRISRQPFGTAADAGAPVLVGDMWWGGEAQNGWGIALLQQYRGIFGVWFTYDENGAPTWFVMPGGAWKDDAAWEGRLYRTRGSPWLGVAYDPAKLAAEEVGSFSVRFEGSRAELTYTIDGKVGTMALMRQGF